MMTKPGVLLVFSGPSGAGKDTILHSLLKNTKQVHLSVSATTRSPREGEEDGKDYYFVSKEQFEVMISQGEMLEYAQYCGNFYGTPKAPVEAALQQGKDVILEIEVNGALQIKKKCPDCATVFVLPPSMEILERRLRRRQTEDEETLLKRLAKAKEEIALAEEYDYIIINDALEDAVDEIHCILSAEKSKTIRMSKIIDEVF